MADDQRPNLFIVGQPKSGTTALHQFLAAHPEVFMSPYKEPSYFCRDLHAESDAYHRGSVYFPIRTPEQYQALFAAARHERVVGESSANYLHSSTAADEIGRFNPAAKVIMLLRNPADFLFSLFQMNVRRAWEPAATIEEALSLDPRRQRGEQLPARVIFPSTLHYSRRVQYHRQIGRFLARFPASQIKLIVYEDFQGDNAAVYRDTLEFLGVDPVFQPEFRRVNPSRVVRHPRLNALVRSRFMIRLGYLLVPQSKHRWVQQNVFKRLLSGKQSIPRLDPGLRKHLMDIYADEVARTSELLGIDLLSRWGYRRTGTCSASGKATNM